MSTSTHTNFIWEHPWSNHLETDRKTPSQQLRTLFISEGSHFGAKDLWGHKTNSLRHKWLMTLPLRPREWLYSNISLNCWQYPNLYCSKWRLEEEFSGELKKKIICFQQGGSKFMKTNMGGNDRFVGWFWFICIWTLTWQCETVRTKWEKNSKISSYLFKLKLL